MLLSPPVEVSSQKQVLRKECASHLPALMSMARLQIRRVKLSWTGLLILGHFIYLLGGATVFQFLEREAENKNRQHFQLEKLHFLANYSCLDKPALEEFVKVILQAWEKGVNPSGNSTNPSNWDFSSSFFFAGTVVTTIGYGNLSPSTGSGQVFCVLYALFGIPLNLAFLNHLSTCLSLHLGRLEWGIISMRHQKNTKDFLLMVTFLVLGTMLFLVLPPVLFSHVEGWTYGESFYYAFITLSTIGFGDYVIGTNPQKHYICVYRSLAGIWVIVGLVWLALLLHTGGRLLQQAFRPAHPAGDQEGFPAKQEEGPEAVQCGV
ncbi:potassium channel, subfamily K, member 16-like isoform X2 [Paramormyrops kingsleyae]|uniref:Potassium two pore domain channel subfamily K member 16 n=2 Tax=Paramormyrops kingsleyae TaxID=1676925 RepID=A0A3B3QK36_9TELE|nr:potassium channel subfamily K member 16-like [Paramormyrops kingsleyae]